VIAPSLNNPLRPMSLDYPFRPDLDLTVAEAKWMGGLIRL